MTEPFSSVMPPEGGPGKMLTLGAIPRDPRLPFSVFPLAETTKAKV